MDNTAIVIIDDDDNFRRVLQRRLEQKSDFAVYAFATAEEALNTSSTCDCHAVLLDMMLGDQSGLDAISLLQQHYQPQHLIMLTGYASIATTVEAMRRGATDYLAKPVALPELLQRLTGTHAPPPTAEAMSPAQVEWEHIQRALLQHQGNISATAKALGMHRRTLQRKLQKRAPDKIIKTQGN